MFRPRSRSRSAPRANSTLEEYWEPSDGSYSDDIRAKFPADAADEALNDQAYIDDLKAACDRKALEARSAAAN